MPIRVYLKQREIAAFEPKDIAEMFRALEMACQALDIGNEAKDRQIIAERIITLARLAPAVDAKARPSNRGNERVAVSMTISPAALAWVNSYPSIDASERAIECAGKAREAQTEETRKDFLTLQQNWLALAASYELSARIEQFDSRSQNG